MTRTNAAEFTPTLQQCTKSERLRSGPRIAQSPPKVAETPNMSKMTDLRTCARRDQLAATRRLRARTCTELGPVNMARAEMPGSGTPEPAIGGSKGGPTPMMKGSSMGWLNPAQHSVLSTPGGAPLLVRTKSVWDRSSANSEGPWFNSRTVRDEYQVSAIEAQNQSNYIWVRVQYSSGKAHAQPSSTSTAEKRHQ